MFLKINPVFMCAFLNQFTNIPHIISEKEGGRCTPLHSSRRSAPAVTKRIDHSLWAYRSFFLFSRLWGLKFYNKHSEKTPYISSSHLPSPNPSYASKIAFIASNLFHLIQWKTSPMWLTSILQVKKESHISNYDQRAYICFVASLFDLFRSLFG